MSEIVQKMQQEIINRSNNFEEQTRGTKDEYNIYREHIQYVYKYVCLLSKDKNVDHEVLELSSLLHDIAMTDRALDRSKHNEYGAEIAEQLLRENGYPEDKVQFVKKCILNHSSKRAEHRTTEEEKILVNADGLSHFDSINNLYSLANNVMELNDEDTIKFIQDKLTRDYNEISDELKYLIQDKYDKVMNATNIKDILNKEVIKMDKKLWLRELTENDGLDGLKYLQDIVNEEGIMVAPAPKDIDETTYPEWLKTKADTAKGINMPEGYIPCTTYWVMLDDKIIGLANIKHYLNDFLRKKGGHLGLSLAKEYRGKGLGYKTTLLLIDKARSEFGIDDILLTNEPDNIASRKLCEKLGAELTDIDEHCHYWIRNMKKVK